MPRLVIWCAGGLIAAALCYRSATESRCQPLMAGRCYDVPVAGVATEFDLRFDGPEPCYLLLVGNLSRDAASREIALAAMPVSRAEIEPWREWSLPEATPTAAPAEPRASEPAHHVARQPAAERNVWLTVTGAMSQAPPTHRQVKGLLRASGRHVDVYVDKDDRVDPQVPQAIAACYDNVILPVIAQQLGQPVDVDGSGALMIVVTGWLDRLEAGQVSLGGMVRPADFEPRGQAPRSNAADVVFLSAGLRPGRHMETLLAHELAHAVAAGVRHAHGGWLGTTIEQPWVSEGLAHVSEDLAGRGWTNLDYRVSTFLARPEASPLVVAGADAARARDAGSRGHTYVLHRWCVQKYGPSALRALIASPCCGEAALTEATGQALDDLMRGHWLRLANADASSAERTRSSSSPLSPLDLHGHIGTRALGGPFVADWDVAHQDRRTLSIAGTAAATLRLSAADVGFYRIRISDLEANVQLSLCPIARDRPQLRITAQTLSDGHVQLVLSTGVDEPVAVQHVAWELVSGPTGSRGAPQSCLRGDELTGVFGGVELTRATPLVSRPLPIATTPAQVWRMHAVAVDAAGRRCCAWTEIRGAARPAAEMARRSGAARGL